MKDFNLSGILLMGIGMVFLAIGFIFFQMVPDNVQTLLDWSYSTNVSITDETFTGYKAVLGITPLLVLVGYLFGGAITGFLGFKVFKGEGEASFSPGNLILMGLSVVFIAIALIFETIMLDGAAYVLHGGGDGISSSFTGLSPFVKMAPMLVHISLLVGAVITGFFGIKSAYQS